MVAQQLLEKLSQTAGNADREKRKALIHQTKSAWLQTLTSLDHEEDDLGTTWNKDARVQEIKIECLRVWHGELFKQDFHQMQLFQVI